MLVREESSLRSKDKVKCMGEVCDLLASTLL